MSHAKPSDGCPCELHGFRVEGPLPKLSQGLHTTRGAADSDWRKPAGLDQDLSQLDPIVCINVEDLNSGGSTLRFTHKDGPYLAEVAVLFTIVKKGPRFRHAIALRDLSLSIDCSCGSSKPDSMDCRYHRA